MHKAVIIALVSVFCNACSQQELTFAESKQKGYSVSRVVWTSKSGNSLLVHDFSEKGFNHTDTRLVFVALQGTDSVKYVLENYDFRKFFAEVINDTLSVYDIKGGYGMMKGMYEINDEGMFLRQGDRLKDYPRTKGLKGLYVFEKGKWKFVSHDLDDFIELDQKHQKGVYFISSPGIGLRKQFDLTELHPIH